MTHDAVARSAAGAKALQDRLPYRRVDLGQQAVDTPGHDNGQISQANRRTVRWLVLPLSVLLCTVQMIVTVLAENVYNVFVTATLISVLSMGFLFLLVLALNPIPALLGLRRWLRPLNRAELVCIFTAMLVTSGIATFGLAGQLVPLVGTPWNPEWNTPQRGWDRDVLPRLNPALYLSVPEDGTVAQREQALQTIREFREGVRPRDAQGQYLLRPADDAGWGQRLTYWQAVFHTIQWRAWLKPLGYWMIFIGACYAMFYSLTYMVLGFWDKREKISFPLAKLPQALLPEEGSRWPTAFKSVGFWAAFLVSMLVLSWNGMVDAGLTGNLQHVPLGMGYQSVAAMLEGTAFDGLAAGRLRLSFLIIFTAIGLAFLLPLEISFSVWFYFLVAQGMIMAAIWAGHAQTGADFPSDFISQTSMVMAQAAGGLLMFSMICLTRYVLDLIAQTRNRPLLERLQLGFPVIGLGISLLIIILWVRWNGVPVMVALYTAVFLALMTVGLMRIVAEGGIFWFQANAGPFHVFQAFGLGRWISPALMAPMMPIYTVLFMDIKTFLAPNLLNSAKMQADERTGRGMFHLNIALCLVVSVVVALGVSIFLAHLLGAQQMNRWFYSSGPQMIMDSTQRFATASEELESYANAGWHLGGAGWVGLSMLIRRTIFWFPHPIGYIMLISPLMTSLWFSFFIGWVCKLVVVKYGGKTTFDRVTPVFIGLIVGELIAILIWTLLGLSFEFTHTLTLNRYGA